MADPSLFDHTWTVTLHHDGQPVANNIPIDDHDLATLIAPLFANLTGAPTSVALAVHTHRATHQAA